ncbi:hypothetical protein SVIOM342S_05704 [Streptomyces violaceorubidus]
MSTATARPSDRRISPVFLGIVAVAAVTGWATWSGFAEQPGLAVFLFVTAAWVVSLCLHEYAHARTALHSGDISVGAKGYLTLNPVKYTHALLSIVLPVLFVIMGGIGLPGGAVFIERGRIRGRWRHSLISAAGPLTNVLFAVVCTAPFWLDALDGVPRDFRLALAFLARLRGRSAAGGHPRVRALASGGAPGGRGRLVGDAGAGADAGQARRAPVGPGASRGRPRTAGGGPARGDAAGGHARRPRRPAA